MWFSTKEAARRAFLAAVCDAMHAAGELLECKDDVADWGHIGEELAKMERAVTEDMPHAEIPR